ncbi:MAG: 2,3-dihydroxy-p-cumate-3,4-dioxygenase, partial [Gammaproteobacteria bacterium]
MIRYLKLGYVALGVTDLDKSVPFYRDVVGLQLNEQADDGTAFLSCSDDHHNIILYQSDTPGLKRVGWEIEDESQFEVAIAHLKGAGLTLTDVSPDECRAGFQQRT